MEGGFPAACTEGKQGIALGEMGVSGHVFDEVYR